MKTVLFDMILTNGHLNASFNIAYKLKKDGYNVVYLSNNTKKQYIENAGFTVEVIQGNIFNKHLLTDKKDIISLVKSIIYDRIYHIKRKYFFIMLKEYEDLLINRISPSLIILDAHCFTKVLIYEKHHCPIIKLNTMICNDKRKYIPPIDIFHIPTFNTKGWIISELLWTYSKFKNMSKYVLFKAILLNQDEITNWLYFAKKLDFPSEKIGNILEQKVLGLSITGYNEVFLYPNKFDFYKLETKNSCFFNIELDEKLFSENQDLDYIELLSLIKSRKYENVIYCSLGTLVHQKPEKFKLFIEKMKIVAQLKPTYLFVLSLGGKMTNHNIQIDNLRIFKYLPQIHLLTYVDLMISHGGTNGLTECLLTNTPILVMSFNQWDNPGCASRVVYHKIGLSAKFHDSPQSISFKISQIINEKDIMKKRIHEMSKHDHENSGYRIIDSFLQN